MNGYICESCQAEGNYGYIETLEYLDGIARDAGIEFPRLHEWNKNRFIDQKMHARNKNECPHCGAIGIENFSAKNIEYIEGQWDENRKAIPKIQWEVTCRVCGNLWSELYSLEKII